MDAEIVNAPKRVGDFAEGAIGIAAELCESPFEAPELRAQDARAGLPFLQKPPQLGFGDRARRVFQYVAQPPSQIGVEPEPGVSDHGVAEYSSRTVGERRSEAVRNPCC